jgi:glycolate oxidase
MARLVLKEGLMERSLVGRFAGIVGEEWVLSSAVDLALYGQDAYLVKGLPDLVVLPGSTAEVSRVMGLARELGLPIIARGAGSNLTGGVAPIKGGVVLHLSRLNQILEIDAGNRLARVQPGVITPGPAERGGQDRFAIRAGPGQPEDQHPGGQPGGERGWSALPEVRGDGQPHPGGDVGAL